MQSYTVHSCQNSNFKDAVQLTALLKQKKSKRSIESLSQF